MNLPRITAVLIAAALACAASGVSAQAPTDGPKAEETKPAKPAKKPATKPAKKPAKKVAKKPPKEVAAQPGQPLKTQPGTTQILGPGTYSTGPTTLRDKDGNVIPTDPKAYGVDSAVKKK